MRATAHESCGAKKESMNRSGVGVRPLIWLALFAVISLLYISAAQSPTPIQNLFYDNKFLPKLGKEYIIRNWKGCSIPEFDPFDKSTRHVFHSVRKPVCSSKPPVTEIRKNKHSGEPEIFIDKNVAKKHYNAADKFTCCYNKIFRHSKQRDQSTTKSKCYPINHNTTLSNSTEFILVSCQNIKKGYRKPKVWYKNAHALIPDKESVLRRFSKTRVSHLHPPISVLLISIDSISRLNLMRSMPKTTRHLHDHGWLELRGYNKIGDNTYPNIMAILAGMHPSKSYNACKPTTLHGLDNCWFIWKNFSNAGYVTAYGEDYPSISTFNYRKKGFYNQPTDYYLRPFILAIKSNIRSPNEEFCSGPVPAGRRIYDYALDFATKFRDDPSFGLFWMNTFSHNEVNMPSTMDGETMTFLTKLQKRGVLDSSIVFFFSDHGIRFGKSRQLFTGFYEERLPFFFAWFPTWFRDRYPYLVESFSENSNRLTTPYDFHNTLLHILSLANGSKAGPSSGTRGCSKSHSLLKPMAAERTCADACIDPHWCTCGELIEFNANTTSLKKMALAAVDHLNDVELRNQTKCSRLTLHRVLVARTLKGVNSQAHQNVIVFETNPGQARFEATISKDKKNKFIVHDQISRLNTYEGQSNCVVHDKLRKYCYCIK